MATEEECKVFNQEIIDMKTDMNNKYRDVHNHIRELRSDLGDNIEYQQKVYSELSKSQENNTTAIHDLTESTQALVDAITAGKVIGNFARWAIPIAVSIAAIVTYFKPPTS